MKYAAPLIEKVIHSELSALTTTLNASNLRHLYFKGTALAYTLYEIPSQRSRCDSDIFIRAQDKQAVGEILLKQGFHCDIIAGEDQIAHQKAYTKEYPWCQVVIDLHWQISNRPLFRQLLNFDEAWSQAQRAP